MRSGVALLPCQLLNIGLVKPISLQIILRGKALPSFFIELRLRPHQKVFSNMRSTRHMNSHCNTSIFGRHAAGKTVLVLREVPACSSQALSGVVPQVDEQTQRLLRDLALATQKLTRGHVVEYVAAATDGNERLYAKQSCAQHLPKPVRAFIYAQTHQEVDMADAHYELIRRYVNSNSLPHIDLLRATLVDIWGEDACVESENIIKMFPVRVINAGAPATLRFLQKHHLAVAGFVSSL